MPRFIDFHGLGVNTLFMSVSTEPILVNLLNATRNFLSKIGLFLGIAFNRAQASPFDQKKYQIANRFAQLRRS